VARAISTPSSSTITRAKIQYNSMTLPTDPPIPELVEGSV
jgi:hypothetical protein